MATGATPPMSIAGTPLAIFLALTLAGAGVVTMPACHQTIPSSIVTPQGKVAYQVEDALDAIGALQHAAIDARKNNLIKTDVMRSIVKGTMAATRSLQAAVENGTGARAAYLDASVALSQVQQALPAAEAQRFAPYFGSVQSVLAALTPPQE
jgi:hypothetical protein